VKRGSGDIQPFGGAVQVLFFGNHREKREMFRDRQRVALSI
jgi:hypothetical protein